MGRASRSLVLILLCILLAPLLHQYSMAYMVHHFGDARIYGDAITRFRAGQSPYGLTAELPFIYPPIFAIAGKWLAGLLTPAVGWRIYTAVHVTSVIAVPFILARFYLRELGYVEAFALFILAPFAVTENAVLGGNVAHPVYCAALLAAAPGLARNRWKWFYVIVVLASAVKITFLALLLLPILAGEGQVISSAITALVTGAIYLSQILWLPDLYRQFRMALTNQTFGARNYGFAPFGAAANLLERLHISGYFIPGAVEILFVAAILLVLWQLRRLRKPEGSQWLALILVSIVLVNPRMFESDVATGLVAAYFLLLSNWRSPSTWFLAAFSTSGFFIRHGALGFLFLFTSAFLAGAWSLMSAPAKAEDARLLATP